MADREKVIKELEERLIEANPWKENPPIRCDAPYQLLCDALELLKEQEPVKPIFVENPYTHLPVSYCPQCRESINKYIVGNPYKTTKFCHYCGKAVEWE